MKAFALTILGMTLLGTVPARAADTHKETVLVAADKGQFFDNVTDRLKTALGDRGVPCIASDMKSLNDSKIGKYLCVVILSAVKGNAPNAKAAAFIRGLNEKEKKKVVLVGTSDKPWEQVYHGIDAIIAPPKDEKADSVTAVVLARIDARLELNRGEPDADTAAAVKPE